MQNRFINKCFFMVAGDCIFLNPFAIRELQIIWLSHPAIITASIMHRALKAVWQVMGLPHRHRTTSPPLQHRGCLGLLMACGYATRPWSLHTFAKLLLAAYGG